MESRLSNLRVYLSGPCQEAINSGAGWRNMITPTLNDMGLTVYDPVSCDYQLLSCEANKQEEFDYVKKLRKEERYEELCTCMKEVVRVDRRMVDSSDVIIANLDVSIHSVGTYDEITTAVAQRKPVYVTCKQGKKNIPLWLFGIIPHQYMFETLDEILKELSRIAYCEESSLNLDRKRWLFVNTLGIYHEHN